MNHLRDLQQQARELSGRVELIEQFRAQLVCNRIDERSLRLGTEGLLREARCGALGTEGAPTQALRSSLSTKRPSRMDQVQLRMAELRHQSQARIGAMQARIQAVYTAGVSSHGHPYPVLASGSR